MGPWFVDGRAVNLSAGGVLVELERGALDGLLGEQEDVFRSVDDAFGRGFQVRFAEAGFAMEAELVRLELPESRTQRVLLGCRFSRVLALVHQHRIGIGSEPDELDSVDLVETPWASPSPFDDLPLEARTTDGVSVLFFDESPAVLGPRFHGHVRTLGDHTFTSRLAKVGMAQVSARLGSRPFGFRVLVGPDVWTGRAALVGARFVDVPGGAVEVAVATEDRPGRRIRRAFRRRRLA